MPKTHAKIFDGIKMDWLSTLFATVLGFAAGVVSVFLILFWLDVSQQHDAVRRNYPVLGRFRGCSFIWASFSEAFLLIGKNCLSENVTLPAAHRRKTPSLLPDPKLIRSRHTHFHQRRVPQIDKRHAAQTYRTSVSAPLSTKPII